MLRKKTHVVRKKTHVVRKFFYVASIFGGAAGRKNRSPWELSSTPWELSSTAGDFSSTASRWRQRLQCVYRALVFSMGAHTSLPDTNNSKARFSRQPMKHAGKREWGPTLSEVTPLSLLMDTTGASDQGLQRLPDTHFTASCSSGAAIRLHDICARWGGGLEMPSTRGRTAARVNRMWGGQKSRRANFYPAISISSCSESV